MSDDFIIRQGSDKYKTLEKVQNTGCVTGIAGSAVSIAGAAASIFCKNASTAEKIFSGISSFGAFAGVLGFAAMGGAYFLKDSVSDAEIEIQNKKTSLYKLKKDGHEIVDKFQGDQSFVSESKIRFWVELAKLSWLQNKKNIQQSVYIMLGWRK